MKSGQDSPGIRDHRGVAHPRHEELQELSDDDDLDGILEIATLDEIAQAYCRYRTEDDEDFETTHPDWWAVQIFFDREIFERQDLYRALLLKLVEHADDERLGAVGAGPLEDFVSDNEDK